jgi:hypothetical protein
MQSRKIVNDSLHLHKDGLEPECPRSTSIPTGSAYWKMMYVSDLNAQFLDLAVKWDQ